MRVPPQIKRYRWPVALVVALGLAIGGGMLVGNSAADGMNPFYANVAAADAERIARTESAPPAEETMPIDNSLPPVAPVDLSFARATRGVTNENDGDMGQ